MKQRVTQIARCTGHSALRDPSISNHRVCASRYILVALLFTVVLRGDPCSNVAGNVTVYNDHATLLTNARSNYPNLFVLLVSPTTHLPCSAQGLRLGSRFGLVLDEHWPFIFYDRLRSQKAQACL